MNEIDRGSISSEDTSESIRCHIRTAPMMQEQPWGKDEVEMALSNLPGGEAALSLIPTLHGDALQRALEEFQLLTLNKTADCRQRKVSLPTFANGYVMMMLMTKDDVCIFCGVISVQIHAEGSTGKRKRSSSCCDSWSATCRMAGHMLDDFLLVGSRRDFEGSIGERRSGIHEG